MMQPRAHTVNDYAQVPDILECCFIGPQVGRVRALVVHLSWCNIASLSQQSVGFRNATGAFDSLVMHQLACKHGSADSRGRGERWV